GDEHIDAGHIHVHDTTSADVEMPDLAVAHLPLREADERARSVNQRVGELFDQRIVGGFAGQGDGVALCFRAVTPAVEHGEHDGFRSFSHSSSGYMDE